MTDHQKNNLPPIPCPICMLVWGSAKLVKMAATGAARVIKKPADASAEKNKPEQS